MNPPRAIYLVGFMGSGKTTIGRILASRLRWRFLDLDDAVESAAGMSIPEIFAKHGEARFREIETDALDRLSAPATHGDGLILALGGGAFATERNRQILAGRGVSLWLDVPLEKAWTRVSRQSHRPLARDQEGFAQLFEARRPSYALADFQVPVISDNPEVTVSSILTLRLPEWNP